ncbi:ABC transporter permease [Streptosporangium minutum]|uniref:Transport permease protein n=1 Tax=Streptosporangium minutum TaxID=569862 RepID=A0A2C9ZMM1_9ACTN|nr:ABC transporter permease [Streptosporangium minutum]OUC98565.1 multidrug ABC transporter permease [Streptosporangium minutum]
MKTLSDTGVVFTREIRPELRNPLGLVFGMIQPLVFLALFGPLLAGTPGVGQASPWQWFVPGVVVMLGLFGTASAGYYLLVEGGGGSLERMLVTPLSRTAMLIGRTMKEIVTLLAQAVLIIAVVLPLGFRLHPAGALAGLLLLTVLGVGLGSLSFALALAARRQPSIFYGVQQTLLFPLVLLSGVLLPMDDAPSWLYGMARANPVTYVVEAERALFAGDLSHPSVPYGVLAAVTVALVGLAVGTRGMRRASL